MRFRSDLGTILLAIYLILQGLTFFGLAFPSEGAILAILAIAAGILLLLGR
jgi:hypothetical protein